MKKYCFNCGAKIEFLASTSPSFAQIVALPRVVQRTSRSASGYARRNRRGYFDFQTDIQGLDFDFDEKSLQQKGEKLGSVVGTLDESQAGQLDNDIPQSELPKYGVKDLEREAGSLRRKKPEGDA